MVKRDEKNSFAKLAALNIEEYELSVGTRRRVIRRNSDKGKKETRAFKLKISKNLLTIISRQRGSSSHVRCRMERSRYRRDRREHGRLERLEMWTRRLIVV